MIFILLSFLLMSQSIIIAVSVKNMIAIENEAKAMRNWIITKINKKAI